MMAEAALEPEMTIEEIDGIIVRIEKIATTWRGCDEYVRTLKIELMAICLLRLVALGTVRIIEK